VPIVVHNTYHQSNVGGGTVTITPPWTPTNGRTLIVWGLRGFDTANSCTDNGSSPIAWTRDLNTQWFTTGDLFFYRRQVVAGSPTSVLLTSDNTFGSGMDYGLAEVSGIDPTTPIDATVVYGVTSGAGTSHNRPITLGQAGSLVFGMTIADSLTANFSGAGSTNLFVADNSEPTAGLHEIFATSGAKSLTWSSVASHTCGAALVAYRAAVSGLSVDATTQELELEAHAASVSLGRSVNAELEALTLTPHAATVSLGRTVNATAAALELVAQQANVTLGGGLTVNATTVALELVAQPATVTLGDAVPIAPRGVRYVHVPALDRRPIESPRVQRTPRPRARAVVIDAPPPRANVQRHAASVQRNAATIDVQAIARDLEHELGNVLRRIKHRRN
jgi:hypothetical protein